jgi:uncharacterized protein (TIGR03083 family)
MTRWTLDRYREEILTQTGLLRELVKGADPRARVPACPAWNLGQLLRHVGGNHRWAETVIRTRATEPVPHDVLDDVFHYGDDDIAVPGAWVAEGAQLLAGALSEAGPGVRVWTPPLPDQPVAFWARRMLFETVVHRADAAGAVAAPFELDPAVGRDGLDEWMDFATLPDAYVPTSAYPQPLLGPGRTLHFLATDHPAERWLVDLTGDAPRWSRADSDTATTPAVSVHGSLPDLLLLVYGRSVHDRLAIHGDAALLDLWVRRTGFWLNE